MEAAILGSILSLVGIPSSVSGMIISALPMIQAGLPVIQALIKEGVPAFAAAKAQAPGLVAAIEQLATHIPNLTMSGDASAHVENVARAIFGFNKMTPDEEKLWMDRATPGNDPSQENSKFTVG